MISADHLSQLGASTAWGQREDCTFAKDESLPLYSE